MKNLTFLKGSEGNGIMHMLPEKNEIKVKFILEQETKFHRGSRDIALLFLRTSALGGGGWSTSRPGRFTPRKDRVSIV
jgi:hypothetical protein